MKNFIYLTAILFICILTNSCKSEDNNNYTNEFETSKANWLNFKESSSDSYKYIVSGGSVFVTYGWETTITVSNGVIIQRALSFTGDTTDLELLEHEWTENEDEINTHPYSVAALPLTLDEIYTKAEENWLISRENTTNYFETDNNGLISVCGFIENGCMDDCFAGIRISSIESLEN